MVGAAAGPGVFIYTVCQPIDKPRLVVLLPQKLIFLSDKNEWWSGILRSTAYDMTGQPLGPTTLSMRSMAI
jgi:hypothetical protein